ncbi:MAG: UDP-N-acetylmuramate dehydrogenase [Spartobacteria bacterium]|nr:UDP-N-acetylmuramate dehydrogenase [Spartobacteria bacterium]
MKEHSTPSPEEAVQLKQITTFKVGGPARRIITCKKADDLLKTVKSLRCNSDPFMVIGGGSNLVFSDEGYDGVIVRYADSREPPQLENEQGCIRCDASIGLDLLAAWTASKGWAGLEFASGIPGTLGGAIAGNAGAFGRCMADVIRYVVCLNLTNGDIQTLSPQEIHPTYRNTEIKTNHHLVVISCILNGSPANRQQLMAERDRILHIRREKHPDLQRFPCAGSTFKNLNSFDETGHRMASGPLLEAVGAKKMRIGDAGVFEKHANMVVSLSPNCRASDIRLLMRQMKDAVWDRFSIRLEPEIQLYDRKGFPLTL